MGWPQRWLWASLLLGAAEAEAAQGAQDPRHGKEGDEGACVSFLFMTVLLLPRLQLLLVL